MTPYQYNLFAQGCALREQIVQLPLRKIFHLLYNVNTKNGLSYDELKQKWPLPDVDKMHVDADQMVEMRDRMRELREANMKRKLRQEELKKRQENAANGTVRG